MVEQQLADYIKSQREGGAPRDAVKAALVGAGWPEADVEDTLKSVEASMPAKAAPAIIVSDLIASSSLEVVGAAPEEKEKEKDKARAKLPEKKVASGLALGVSKRNLIAVVALGVVAAVLAAASVFFFLQNRGLQDKIAADSGAIDAAATKVVALNSQADNLNKQIADQNAQLTALTGDNQKLLAELSFFVVLAGSPPTETAFTLKGSVAGGGKSPYTVAADDGLKVSVKNSKDTKVDAALKPLVGQTAEISGTHVIGSRDVTVTSVNGALVQ